MNGADHCICVHKKLGKYIVYDPNYRDGFRYFDDEIELVKQLHQCFSKNPVSYKPEPGIPLLLGIKVLRHPSLKNPRIPPFPNPCNLYEKYLAPQQRIADIERRLNDTLLYASKDTNDDQAIEKLMTLGATEFKEAIFGAIMNNNLHATRLLLEKIIALHPSEIENCIRYALYSGYEEIVSILATMCKIDYEKSLDIENLSITVFKAILGGNHKILARLLLDARKLFCQKNNIPDNAENEKKINDELVLNIFREEDYFQYVIKENNADCIRLLIEFMDKSSYAMPEEGKIEYLLMAIRMNKSSAVKYLITQVSFEAIKSLVISTNAVERTELSILLLLQQNGVAFSDEALGIIKKKEHQIIDFSLHISIIFRKFTDYLIELLCQDAGVNINPRQFQFFKEAQKETARLYEKGPETMIDSSATHALKKGD